VTFDRTKELREQSHVHIDLYSRQATVIAKQAAIIEEFSKTFKEFADTLDKITENMKEAEVLARRAAKEFTSGG